METIGEGIKIKEIIFGHPGWVTVYEYYATGRTKRRLHYNADGSLDKKSVYLYNRKGFYDSITDYDDDCKVLCKRVYTYEYDSYGNWTKRTTLRQAANETGEPSYERTYIDYRTIIYYLNE